jgi:hypothetical protein
MLSIASRVYRLVLAFCLIPAFIFSLLLVKSLMAQTDAFREAAAKEGCDAIPYQSERNLCKERSWDKDRVCTAYTCNKSDVDKDLANYKEALKNQQDAKDRKNEEGARALEKKVAELREKLEAHKRLASDRVEHAKDCLEARERVQRSFSDALQKVQQEKSPELQPYVATLAQKFKDGRESHLPAIQEAIRAMDNCQKVKETSW